MKRISCATSVLAVFSVLGISCQQSAKSGAPLEGTWLEPNPINAKEVQGFTLKDNGEAESVNMATLLCKKWKQEDQTLYLTFTSIGNGMTIESTDTLTISKLDADSLILTSGGREVWKLGRKK